MHIAVTGGTGFIGRRLVRDLRAAQHEVTCVVRRPEAAGALADLGAKLVAGDLLDRASLARGFAGADAVFHLAASYEMGVVGRRAETALRTNLEGTQNALEAAVASGASKVLYTSSIVVNGTTAGRVVDETFRYRDDFFATHYSMSKHRAHVEVVEPMLERGAPIVVLQPGAVLGPGDTSIYRVIFDWMARGIPLPIGGAAYAMVDVDECVRAHVLALEKGRPGECYYVVAENLPLTELVRRTERATGVKGRMVRMPDWLMKAQALAMAALERIVPVPPVFSRDGLRGQCSDVTMLVSGEKARAELGFSPRPLDDVLRDIMRDELTRLGKPLPPLLASSTPPPGT